LLVGIFEQCGKGIPPTPAGVMDLIGNLYVGFRGKRLEGTNCKEFLALQH
jgi:hypothetical protein